MSYQCMKTGANIYFAGIVAYGDLFQFGEGWFMNVASWVDAKGKTPEGLLNAEFDSYHQWFGRYEDRSHNVSVVMLKDIKWFSYEGQTLPKNSS
jgi:uncharacterized membrane protein